MAVNFPNNPSNGDTVVVGGITYYYSSTLNTWSTTATSGGPITTFTNLTDTPTDFTSAGGKTVAVNSGATALEFVDAAPGVPVYSNYGTLPTTGNTEGDLAYLTNLQRLVAWDGTGWAGVALQNDPPTAITGLSASYSLNAGDPAEVITLNSTDLEGATLTWSYAVTSGALGNATVSQSGNVFTVTPTTSSSGTFELTFTVSDGVNDVTASASFTITNQSPSAITGLNSSYTLADDGTATVITLSSTDPEGGTLTWSHEVTTGTLGSTATITQSANVFTITPSTDSANAGTFGVTFTASDGANEVTATASFELAFSNAWQLSISGNSYGTDPYSMAIDSNDNIYVVGQQRYGVHRAVIYKIDKDGAIQWHQLYVDNGNATSGRYAFTNIAIDGNDNIYVVGHSQDSSSTYRRNANLVKFTTAGAISWQRRIDASTTGTRTQLHDVVISPDNNSIFVAGTSEHTTLGGSDLLLMKFNSSGSVQWQKEIGSVSTDSFDDSISLACADNSDVYLMGNDSVRVSGGAYRPSPAVYKVASSNGAISWRRQPAPLNSTGAPMMYGYGLFFQVSNSKLGVISIEYTTLGGSNSKPTLRIDYISTSSGNKSGSTLYTYIPQQNDTDPQFALGRAAKVALDSSYNVYIPVSANRETTQQRWRAGYIKVANNGSREMENNFISRAVRSSPPPSGVTTGSLFYSRAMALNSEGALIMLSQSSDLYSNLRNRADRGDLLLTSIDPTVAYSEYDLGTDSVYSVALSDFSTSTSNEAQHSTDSSIVLYTTSGSSQNAGLTVSTPAESLATTTYLSNLDTF